MKFCNNCKKLSPGEPLFCLQCSRSFNVKLCPARHINPRSAVACGECGSRDLSTPAPPLSFPVWLLLRLLPLLTGAFLLWLSMLALLLGLRSLLSSQQLQATFFLLILIIALLWFVYLQLPRPLKDLVGPKSKKPRKDSHGH